MNELQTGQSNDHTKAKHVLNTNLLSSPEGHILLTGFVLGLGYIVWLVVTSLVTPVQLQTFVAMTATHVLFGRAAGMSFGYTANLGDLQVISLSMVIESIVVLFFYPLFVFSWRHLLILPILKKTMDRIHKAAETHRQLIHRYGLLGLVLFVWFPFWMTGSLVGCVIGFLLELRPWVTVAVVLGGAYGAIISWAILLRHLHDHMSGFSPYAPLIILAILIFLALLGHFIPHNTH